MSSPFCLRTVLIFSRSRGELNGPVFTSQALRPNSRRPTLAISLRTRAPDCSLPASDCPSLQRHCLSSCLRYKDSQRHLRSAASKAGNLFAIANLRRPSLTRVQARTCCTPQEPRDGLKVFAPLFQLESSWPRLR